MSVAAVTAVDGRQRLEPYKSGERVTCRDEILASAQRLCQRDGANSFTIVELIEEMHRGGTIYQESTIPTYVASRLCANAPHHHAVTYPDLERVGPGRYRLL